MSEVNMTLELPTDVFQALSELAQESHIAPSDLIAQWLVQERKRRRWLQEWKSLQQQVIGEGGFEDNVSAEAIVAQTRKTRQEIWDAEYAHLYR